MNTFSLRRLFNIRTSPLVPHFRYEYTVETPSLPNSFGYMKEVFEVNGGHILTDTPTTLLAEIRAAKLARSPVHLPDLLRIELQATSSSQIKVTVVSVGQRRAYLTFFAISVVLSVIGILRKGELFALIFPLGTYGIVLQHSIYPNHPAHKLLREMIHESGYEEEAAP